MLTLVEMGVVRMYTGDLFRPWNNALRGVDANHKPDGNAGASLHAVGLFAVALKGTPRVHVHVRWRAV